MPGNRSKLGVTLIASKLGSYAGFNRYESPTAAAATLCRYRLGGTSSPTWRGTNLSNNTLYNVPAAAPGEEHLVAAKAAGVANEGRALSMYSFNHNSAIINQNKLYRTDLWPGVRLAGRIDAMTATGELLEVKCRQTQLFTHIPRRERAQLFAYMHLTGHRQCTMVQMLGSQLQTDVVHWDDQFWEVLLVRLKAFLNTHT